MSLLRVRTPILVRSVLSSSSATLGEDTGTSLVTAVFLPITATSNQTLEEDSGQGLLTVLVTAISSLTLDEDIGSSSTSIQNPILLTSDQSLEDDAGQASLTVLVALISNQTIEEDSGQGSMTVLVTGVSDLELDLDTGSSSISILNFVIGISDLILDEDTGISSTTILNVIAGTSDLALDGDVGTSSTTILNFITATSDQTLEEDSGQGLVTALVVGISAQSLEEDFGSSSTIVLNAIVATSDQTLHEDFGQGTVIVQFSLILSSSRTLSEDFVGQSRITIISEPGLNYADRSAVRFLLGYTSTTRVIELARLNYAMANIYDQATVDRIKNQITRSLTAWDRISMSDEELVEQTKITGYYQQTIDYSKLPSLSQRIRTFDYEITQLAISLGVLNLRGIDPTQIIESAPINEIVLLDGIQGEKGDPGERVLGLLFRSFLTHTLLLAANQTQQVVFDITKSFVLLSCDTSSPVWVRIYDSIAAQTADASRSPLVDPIEGSGVMAEFTTILGALTVNFSPPPIVTSRTNIDTVPITVTNNSVTPLTVTLIYTFLELE